MKQNMGLSETRAPLHWLIVIFSFGIPTIFKQAFEKWAAWRAYHLGVSSIPTLELIDEAISLGRHLISTKKRP